MLGVAIVDIFSVFSAGAAGVVVEARENGNEAIGGSLAPVVSNLKGAVCSKMSNENRI